MKRNERWAIFIAVTSVILLVFLFIPGLGESAFGIDDSSLFNQNFLRTPWTWKSLKLLLTPGFSPDYYPVRDFSVWIDWTFSKQILVNTTVPKIHNFLWLCGSAYILFLIIEKLTNKLLLSVIFASAWLLHPFHFESLQWISARKDLMAWFFILAASLLTIDIISTKGKPSKLALFYSVVFFLFSVLSKATFLFLPFTLLGWMIWRKRIRGEGFTFEAWITVAFSAVVSVFLAALNYWNYSQNNNMKMDESVAIRLSSVLAALGKNVVGVFIPLYNTVDVEPWGGWYRFNGDFILPGVIATLLFIFIVSYGLKKKSSAILLSCALVIGVLVMTPGYNPNHRNYYSIRYFEPIFLVIIIGTALYFARFKKAVNYGLMILMLIAISAVSDAGNWQSNLSIAKKSYGVSPRDPSLRGMLLLEYQNMAQWGRLTQEEQLDRRVLYESTIKDCVFSEKIDGRCLFFISRIRNFTISMNEPRQKEALILKEAFSKVVQVKNQMLSDSAKSEVAWNVFAYKKLQGDFDREALRDYFASHHYFNDDATRLHFLLFRCLDAGDKISQDSYRQWLEEGLINAEELNQFIADLKFENQLKTVKNCFKIGR